MLPMGESTSLSNGNYVERMIQCHLVVNLYLLFLSLPLYFRIRCVIQRMTKNLTNFGLEGNSDGIWWYRNVENPTHDPLIDLSIICGEANIGHSISHQSREGCESLGMAVIEEHSSNLSDDSSAFLPSRTVKLEESFYIFDDQSTPQKEWKNSDWGCGMILRARKEITIKLCFRFRPSPNVMLLSDADLV